jgi:SsrA-binding protein
MAPKKQGPVGRIAVQNRKARYNYFIDDTLEAGIALVGTEVKALRAGKSSIGEAFAAEQDGELYLMNAHIGDYDAARDGHAAARPRKLLLHRREIARLFGMVQREGVTLVPLSLYFNPRGIAKVELAVARGKRKYDKRETIKERDWKRDKARLMRERG